MGFELFDVSFLWYTNDFQKRSQCQVGEVHAKSKDKVDCTLLISQKIQKFVCLVSEWKRKYTVLGNWCEKTSLSSQKLFNSTFDYL